jgi:hypothetical protein
MIVFPPLALMFHNFGTAAGYAQNDPPFGCPRCNRLPLQGEKHVLGEWKPQFLQKTFQEDVAVGIFKNGD